jgi:hypothetical protein
LWICIYVSVLFHNEMALISHDDFSHWIQSSTMTNHCVKIMISLYLWNVTKLCLLGNVKFKCTEQQRLGFEWILKTRRATQNGWPKSISVKIFLKPELKPDRSNFELLFSCCINCKGMFKHTWNDNTRLLVI